MPLKYHAWLHGRVIRCATRLRRKMRRILRRSTAG
jgi:hypothetical protein